MTKHCAQKVLHKRSLVNPSNPQNVVCTKPLFSHLDMYSQNDRKCCSMDTPFGTRSTLKKIVSNVWPKRSLEASSNFENNGFG